MRFLIGLVSGTVLTLLVATAVDAPTRPILEMARDRLADTWHRLIEETSGSLFPTIEAPAEPDPAPASSVKAGEPALTLAPPAEPTPSSPVRVTPPGHDEPDAAAPGDEPADLPLDVDSQATETASAWVPFHSQMSAQGFAARLTQELDHDFRVERRGAGSYQVVFDAASPHERDLLLAGIAEITGR